MSPVVLPDWLKTIIISFLSKTPIAFKVIQVVLGISTFVTGLPALLLAVGVTNLPPAIVSLENKAISIFGIIAALLLQFTTDIPKVVSKYIGKTILAKDMIMMLLLVSTIMLSACNHKPTVVVTPIPVNPLIFSRTFTFASTAGYTTDSTVLVGLPELPFTVWYKSDGSSLHFYADGYTELNGPGMPFTDGYTGDTIKVQVINKYMEFTKSGNPTVYFHQF